MTVLWGRRRASGDGSTVLSAAFAIAWAAAVYLFSAIGDWRSQRVVGVHDAVSTGWLPHKCTSGKEAVRPFTQGLLYSGDSTILETSGLHAASFLREFWETTGETFRRVDLPNDYFAEGAALVVEPSTLRLYVMVLTYTDNVILMYDYVSFELAYTHPMHYVGFGLTSNYDIRCADRGSFVKRQKVWMTTGGDQLVSLALPRSFSQGAPSPAGAVPITLNGRRLIYVNEMEYNPQSGTIYANVWQTNYIVEIDPGSGACVNVWDLGAIAAKQPRLVDVMNGIACHPAKSHCLITGKFWPQLFGVALRETGAAPRAIPPEFYEHFCREP
ncbi:glutaminyl-peptide cyclotransferase, putative [Babesia caballi]|uniref:Glutaminyl-peptide cyclotransferase, putative n=1 Tax=Babesia caballi TaxID=5871 RepID=A0AAV4M1L7_BABCB|nr:glutaminyl-peptide cyclotransferase, putative [Babesia caballi]